jgi:hypothetical protein
MQLCPFSCFQDELVSFRHDVVWADRKRDDYVVVNHEKDAVTVSDVEIKDWMLVPSDSLEFVRAQRWMPPIGSEARELFAR